MSLNAFADGYNKGYSAGYDDATEDRAYIPARVRALEAEVAEARAEAAKWSAELDGERAAVVAALRRASNRGPMGLSLVDLDSIADGIERGDHRAGGAR